MKDGLLISIVNYRSSPYLLILLKCLEKCLFPDSYSVSLIIVDNASGDEGLEELRLALGRLSPKFDTTLLVESKVNLGFGGGHNLAFRSYCERNKGVPKFFAILNPDTECSADCFEGLLKFLGENKGVALMSPRVVEGDGAENWTCRRFPSALSELEQNAQWGLLSNLLHHKKIAYQVGDSNSHYPEWVPASFVIVRGDCFKKIEGFDEGFFLYFEDIDLCQRLSRIGYTIAYHPQITVKHIIGTSTGISREHLESVERPRYWFDARKWYFLKQHGRLYLGVSNLFAIAGMGIFLLKCFVLRRKSDLPRNYLIDFIRYSF